MKKIAHREPAHNEKGARGSMSAHKSHGSPASVGASIGPGPMPGAGELMSPGAGPGPAASRIRGATRSENPTYPTPPGTAPRGMKTYNQE